MLQITASHLSSGCNQLYNCLDWSTRCPYPIIYGASQQIYLYSADCKKVSLSLSHHEGQITALKFINNQPSLLILSGSIKGELLLWEDSNNDPYNLSSWKLAHSIQIKQHILFIKTFEIQKSFCLVACCLITGKVIFYSIDNGSIQQLEQELEFGNNVMLTIDFLQLNNNCYLVVFAGLDYSLHFYYINKDQINSIFYITSIKAHQNAINDISFTVQQNSENSNENKIFLGTASRDSTIKIWELRSLSQPAQPNSLLFSKKNHQFFQIQSSHYEFELITALSSHTYHVTSLSWGKIGNQLCLAAASFDSTISLWVPDQSSNAWINKYTLGQLTKSNKDGFFFVTFNRPNYNQLIAYTLQGKFYFWNVIQEQDDWKFSSDYCISGHFGKITDLKWNSTGDYLATCSKDQTTRIYLNLPNQQNWIEVSRAQIHGYDINAISWKKLQNPQNNSDIYFDCLISGADEKPIRIFEPTTIFANWTNFLTKNSHKLFITSKEEEQKCIVQNQDQLEYKVVTETGQVVLGLMNKQVQIEKENCSTYHEQEDNDNSEQIPSPLPKTNLNFHTPPNEDQLILHTLWPEMNKFYGHSFEIKSITSQNRGDLIASCSKSLTQQHAAILIWSFSTCKLVDKIIQHKMTVTQLEFSKDDQFLGFFYLFIMNFQALFLEIVHFVSTDKQKIHPIPINFSIQMLLIHVLSGHSVLVMILSIF